MLHKKIKLSSPSTRFMAKSVLLRFGCSIVWELYLYCIYLGGRNLVTDRRSKFRIFARNLGQKKTKIPKVRGYHYTRAISNEEPHWLFCHKLKYPRRFRYIKIQTILSGNREQDLQNTENQKVQFYGGNIKIWT